MKYLQLDLLDTIYENPLIDRIATIINCQDRPVLTAIAKALDNFRAIPPEQIYVLSFSGGKDSHLLLGIYNLYLRLGFEPLNLSVKFADTKLEHKSLYHGVNQASAFCLQEKIPWEIVHGKRSYWFIQFALGYPVPDFRIRWCTGKLKVQPLQPSKKIKGITGRHFGESKSRDDRLNKSCGTDTCGTDKIKDSYDPIIHFSNCLVWDCLYYFDGSVLYEGVFDLLKAQYEKSVDTKTGSLRLGCFMCPVISLKTINQNLKDGLLDRPAVAVRLLLEDLRTARRIKNPRTKKNGAIYVGDRRKFWSKLNKEYLERHNWIEPEDIQAIDLALKSDYSYPPSYKKDWIDTQHQQLLDVSHHENP